MTTVLLFLLVCGLFVWILRVNFKLDKEIKRNRMHQAFTAGIIRTISDYQSKTDLIDEFDLPDGATELPIPYQTILENIDWELSKDLLMANYEKWLRKDKNIFFDEKEYGDDGFNFMYLDLFDKKLKLWHSEELMSPKMKEWLSEDIIVTEENLDELKGEIHMIRDLMTGKLPDAGFTSENINERFAIMFSHIRSSKLQEAKNIIMQEA